MKRLLVADDEPGVRALVRMSLGGDDFEIYEAGNGDDALELARRHLPTLVLLDVMMPGRSGLEVCEAIKSDPLTAHIIVVMLTARAQDRDRADGLAAGADDYFTKPFSPLALIRKVESTFEHEGVS